MGPITAGEEENVSLPETALNRRGASAFLAVSAAKRRFAPQARAQNDVANLLQEKCSGCHGADGSGNTAVGKAVSIPNIRSPEVQKTDAELMEMISEGKRSNRGFSYSMPSNQKLSDQRIKQLVGYTRALGKR